MSDRDDEIRQGLEALAAPADPAGALERVALRRRRLRVLRQVQRAGLAAAVVAGTVVGIVALTRAFDFAPRTPSGEPRVGPTDTPSPSPRDARCPAIGIDEAPSHRYRPTEGSIGGDVLGDGRRARARIFADPAKPPRCRYFLIVEQPGGGVLSAPVRTFPWLVDVPSLLLAAEIDGQPGVEIVVDFGGWGHPHRTGQVFTFEPTDPSGGDGFLVPMRLQPPGEGEGHPIFFPLGGEFPAGVDCLAPPGRIVVTTGGLAEGKDTHFDVTRATYRVRGVTFLETASESLTVEVGTERERWPELADDPFRSCPRG